MIDKLKNHLDNISDEQFRKEWDGIEKMNLPENPTVKEFISEIKSTCPFRCGFTTINNCSWCGRSYKDGIRINK